MSVGSAAAADIVKVLLVHAPLQLKTPGGSLEIGPQSPRSTITFTVLQSGNVVVVTPGGSVELGSEPGKVVVVVVVQTRQVSRPLWRQSRMVSRRQRVPPLFVH